MNADDFVAFCLCLMNKMRRKKSISRGLWLKALEMSQMMFLDLVCSLPRACS